MTAILGISAYYHDSAAALVVDGDIVAAAQEERFTRVRHDSSFPKGAVAYCLDEAGLRPDQIDYVCYYEKPLRKLDRLLETYLAIAPRGFASFRAALPSWLEHKLFLPARIRRELGGFRGKGLLFSEHHLSHAASAFFPSPYPRAAILTCDGVGEWATTTWGVGDGNTISLKQQLSFPHSLGLLYSAFTTFTGFKVNSGEYKMMGLAPFGKPIYADRIRRELIDIKADGSYRLNLSYFDYLGGLRMTNRRFARLFDGPARRPEARISQREMDLAASVQLVTEEILLRLADHIHAQTRADALCIAGGVALNCVANGELRSHSKFRDLWVQPAAGDAGGALGAALLVWYQLAGNPRTPAPGDSQKGSLLGPAYGPTEVRAALQANDLPGTEITDEAELLDRVADELRAGKVVGWFWGRMEFGPRALGSRSILGDPRNPRMQSLMNQRIKFRESFRPFAPCVLRERAHEVFEMSPGEESPYMLSVAQLRDDRRLPLTDADQARLDDPDLNHRLAVQRSDLPAITHVDYSARIQTVDAERHGRFYRLLKTFEAKTGCPVLVNTSFNVRGEPIVRSVDEALGCFLHTGMDTVVLHDTIVRKVDLPEARRTLDPAAHLAQFGAD